MSGNVEHSSLDSSSLYPSPTTTVSNTRKTNQIISIVSVPILASIIAGLFVLFTAPHQAHAAATSFPDVTRVGIHNAYDKSRFKFFIDALESGTGQVEIDVWQDFLLSGQYYVSDSSPLANNNNCETATSYSQLRSQNRNQNFSSCLEDIALWQQHDPNHAPLIIKLELKNGFETGSGYGPTRLDAMLKQYLGANNLYTPADLMGSTYADVDSATRAGAWPSASQLTGKIIPMIQAGAYEQRVKSYRSDHEYADYLTSLRNAGTIAQAAAFPIYLGASTSDPRPADSRRSWSVIFGEDATNFLAVDTSFYYTNHYLIIMTKAESVLPAIDDINPTQSDAYNRVNLLAAHGATIVSVDWTSPTLLSYTTDRA